MIEKKVAIVDNCDNCPFMFKGSLYKCSKLELLSESKYRLFDVCPLPNYVPNVDKKLEKTFPVKTRYVEMSDFAVGFGKGVDKPVVEIMVEQNGDRKYFQFDSKYEKEVEQIHDFIDTMNMYIEDLKQGVQND
jgi:hypothetical protein